MSDHPTAAGGRSGGRTRRSWLVPAAVVGLGLGLGGLVLSVRRWVAAERRAFDLPIAAGDDVRFRLASAGQRASFALAAGVLVIAAIGAITTSVLLVGEASQRIHARRCAPS